MHSKAINESAATAFALLILFTLVIQAQEYRRVQPAFPIGAGEKMLVITPTVFVSTPGQSMSNVIYPSEADKYYYQIELPVGTTLKRLIVELMDHDDTDSSYIRMRVIRMENSSANTVILRTVDTLGGTSGITQLISNPMNHEMMQGWTYFVRFQPFGDLSYNAYYRIGAIKIIYEP